MILARHLALLAGVLLLVSGLALKPMPWWELAPLARDLGIYLALHAGAALLLVRAFRVRFPLALLGVAVLAPVLLQLGIATLLATGLVLAAGLAIGGWLVDARREDPLLSVIAGVGVLAAVLGWLLPLPVHRPGSWLLVLAALVAIRRRQVIDDVVKLAQEWRLRIDEAPWLASACAIVLVGAGSQAWLPLRSIDDLAYHANLGWELIQYGHGRLDVGSQAWALAPWSTDLLHALVMMLSAREVIGPLNFFWLLAATLLSHRLAIRLGLDARKAWWSAMLYASLPMSSALSGSMQVESATPALLAALALALPGATDRATGLRMVAALAGFLMGAKASNALLLLPFLAWMAWQWRRSFPWRALPGAMLLGGFIAGSSYAYAGILTGNPVLPVFNAWFRSPWFPAENFVDARWQTGLPWNLPWRLVLDTASYIEGSRGAAGLALLGLSTGLLLAPARRDARTLLLVSLSGLLLVFSQVQYLRYIHPVMPLLLPVMLSGLFMPGARQAWLEAWLGVLVVAQLWLMPSAAWMVQHEALRRWVGGGVRAVQDEFVPERGLAAYFRARASATDRLLYADPGRSHAGELPGMANSVAWFTPLVSKRLLARIDDPAAWAEAVAYTGANHLMVHAPDIKPGLASYLVQSRASLVARNGAAELYRLPFATPPTATQVQPLRVELSVAKPYPVIGAMVVRLQCSRPGEPIALAWQLSDGQGRSRQDWQWLPCGIDGVALARMGYATLDKAGALSLGVAPAQAGSRMEVSIVSMEGDVRRNLDAETALYRHVWRALCPLEACRPESLRLLPVQ